MVLPKYCDAPAAAAVKVVLCAGSRRAVLCYYNVQQVRARMCGSAKTAIIIAVNCRSTDAVCRLSEQSQNHSSGAVQTSKHEHVEKS